ncbi:MAG: hypothetical protein COC01_00490 [Bacteroidetes bacterium]|nr:MAG: hypothetical protein COC01_00490 [Bacteroidota bacterium]
MSKLTQYLLCGFLIALPFISSNSSIDPVLLPRSYGLGVFVCCFLLLLLYVLVTDKKSSISLPIWNPITLGLIAFIAISFISEIWAINVVDALWNNLKGFMFLSFLLAVFMALRSTSKALLILAVSFSISGFIICLEGFHELYFAEDFTSSNMVKIRSFLANKNLLSSILALSFPFNILAIILVKKRAIKIVISLALIANLVLIFLLQTRSVWMALIIAGFLSAIIYFFIIKKGSIIISKKIRWSLATLFIIVLSCISYIYKSNYSSYFNRVSLLFDSTQYDLESASKLSNPGSIAGRLILWGKTFELIKDNFLTGVGTGNWKIIIPKYGTTGLRIETRTGTKHYQRPHNDFLWVCSENGIFGLLSYILIFMATIYYSIILIKRSTNNDKLVMLVILGGFLIYCVIACFSFPKERIMHQVVLFSFLGIVLAKCCDHKIISTTKLDPRKFILLVSGLLLCSIYTVSKAHQRLESESLVRQAIIAKDKQQWNQVIRTIEEIDQTQYNMDPMATPINWYSGISHFYLNDLDRAFEDFETAYAIHPNHIHVINNLATCYEFKKDHQKAIKLYNDALKISPRFAESVLNLAAIYFNQGKNEMALKTIRKHDPYSHNPKFMNYLSVIIGKLIDQWLPMYGDGKDILIKVKANTETIRRINRESLKEGREYKDQLTLYIQQRIE